jgi:molybdenum cofactor guanylyltransferase
VHDTGAVILAGGRSRRFGAVKAHASWKGLRLVDHVVDALPCALDAMVLVLRADQDGARWPVARRVHDDARLPEGPLRGLIVGLEACETPWNFVVACDLPGLRTPLLRALRAAATDDVDAVVPRWHGRLQPLCAVYARRAVTCLRSSLLAGEGAVVRAIDGLRVLEFDEDRCRRHDCEGASFVNVNRTGDLLALDESVRVSRSSGPGAGGLP